MNEPGQRTQRWKNPLWTCGIGCGAFVIVAIVALAGFYFWAVSPGPQIPTQRVLGAESLAFLRIDQISHDEGFQSMASDILLDMQDLQFQRSGGEMPLAMGWLRQVQRSSPTEVVSNLKRDLPRDITVTVESPPGSEGPSVAIAVNLARYPRLIRLFVTWMTRDIAAEFEEDFPGAGLEFVENTAIWAQTPEVMAIVMDRAQRPVPPPASSEILGLLEAGAEPWDIYAAADNRQDLMVEAARLLAEIPSDFPLKFPENTAQLLPTVKTIFLGLDIASRDLVHIRLEATLQSDADARQWEEMLNEFVEINRPAADSPLQLTAEVIRIGSQTRLDLNMTEVKAAIFEAIRSAEKEEGPAVVPTPEKAPGG